MKRAGLYVRVSTEEQKIHGISIDSQIEALKTYCTKNGYDIAGIYNDAGISARKRYTRRPALLELIEDCKRGKIDIILFTLLDRWFRSVADYHEVQTILDECGVPWRAIWEDYETETSSGILKVNIMLSVAQAEADRTSEKVKATLAYKVAQGEYVGKVPPGYMLDEDMKLKKDPDLEKAIQSIFDGYLAYKSIKEITETAQELGFKATRVKVYRVLSNPVYAGRTKSGIDGVDPYVTPEQWSAITRRKRQYTRSTKQNWVYLFNGLVKCGLCGGSYICKSSPKARSRYYGLQCTRKVNEFEKCKSKTISEKKLERYLLERLDDIIAEENEKYAMSAELVEKKSAEAEKKKLTARLIRIVHLYEDGDISRNDYVRKREDINAKLASLSEEPRKEPPKLPENWREAYDGMTKKGQSEFWHRIIDTIIFDSIGGNHTVILRKI